MKRTFVVVLASIIALATFSASSRALADPSPVPSGTTPERAPGMRWDFADDDAFPIELRHASNVIESAGGSVVVSATVDGTTGSFLLDTGAGTTFLSSAFADRAGLVRSGTSSFFGIAGNHIASTLADVTSFAFGKSVLHNVTVSIAPGDSGTLGHRLDGTIGYEFFAKAIVDVDLSAQRMHVYDPARYEPTVAKNSFIFDIDLKTQQPVIVGSIGNGIAIHPIIDTGNELLLSLSDSLRDHNRLVASHVATLYFSGADGRTNPVDCGRVNRASFGPIDYDGPIVCFFSGPIFGKEGGIIGFDFLQHFNWTIDYPDKKFVLTPNGL